MSCFGNVHTLYKLLKKKKTQYFTDLRLRFIMGRISKVLKKGWIMLTSFLVMNIDELLGLE